jgi:sugar O-acyltransferase (sialic acid O-acetyltransferase NeuD family)
VIAVTIPTTDVNTESAVVVRWYPEDRAEVAAGDPLAEIETSKAIIDVIAQDSGVLLQLVAAGDQVNLDQPLAYLFENLEMLERHEQERAPAAPPPDEHAGRITEPARRRAAELGLDIEEIARNRQELITTKVVDAAAARLQLASGARLPEPLETASGVQRLVIVGAGLGATQVIDILLHDESQQAVAIVDDNPERAGDAVSGIPVVGGIDRALALFADRAIDAAIISISTSVPARARLRQRCEQAGLPLANAIDPTARIASGVRIGRGNVICANCHLGVETVLGDNNFISAYNSFDHHNELGSDISTGPGCMTSGLVKLGDRCRLGTGIFIEPHVTIGTGAQIASGAVILGSIPPEHAVKTKLVTTTVVPIRTAS